MAGWRVCNRLAGQIVTKRDRGHPHRADQHSGGCEGGEDDGVGNVRVQGDALS